MKHAEIEMEDAYLKRGTNVFESLKFFTVFTFILLLR